MTLPPEVVTLKLEKTLQLTLSAIGLYLFGAALLHCGGSVGDKAITPGDGSVGQLPQTYIVDITLGPVAPNWIQNASSAVPLHATADVTSEEFRCSAAFIAPALVLTASHCLAIDERWIIEQAAANLFIENDDDMRACLGYRCRNNPSAGLDLGIAHVNGLFSNRPMAPAHFKSVDFPPMVMLGFGSGGKPNARVVCNARFLSSGDGLGKAKIDPGDSGAALVAVLDNGADQPAAADLVILGVAFGKPGPNSTEMYFTPVPKNLPTPRTFHESLPTVNEYDTSTNFRKIQDCK